MPLFIYLSEHPSVARGYAESLSRLKRDEALRNLAPSDDAFSKYAKEWQDIESKIDELSAAGRVVRRIELPFLREDPAIVNLGMPSRAPNGPALARSGSTWMNCRSPVQAAN